jgi:HNH endonuclease
MDLQRSRCFYCTRPVAEAGAHVDHFVPWARYPTDLSHNFVLADGRCNNQKRDRLPAMEHLATWVERNGRYGDQLRDAPAERGIIAELAASNRVAQWAYAQTEAVNGLTWLRADEMVRWIGSGGRCLLERSNWAVRPWMTQVRASRRSGSMRS